MASPVSVEKAGLHSDDDPAAIAFDEQRNRHSLNGNHALATEAIEFKHALERCHARGLGDDRGFRRHFAMESVAKQLRADVAVEAVAEMLIVIVPETAFA